MAVLAILAEKYIQAVGVVELAALGIVIDGRSDCYLMLREWLMNLCKGVGSDGF